MSESPTCFNLWSAISVVSATLKNRVWIRRGNYTLYPNQYIILVAPPSVGKGTAIKPAHKFAKDIPNPYANYIEDRITAPKLVETLTNGFPCVPTINANGNLMNGKDTTCVLQAEELPTLINSSDWMSDFLTKTWEGGEFTHATKGGGKQLAKGLCVSLIGACTPDFIKIINKNKGTEISNGFASRVVFVFATEKSKSIVWPKGFVDDPSLTDKLTTDLQAISQLHGEFMFSPIAKVLYERKYYEIDKSKSEEDSDIVKYFKGRQSTHILKVAMALSAATDDSLVINDWAMATAISFIDGVLLTLDDAFRGVGDSELAEPLAKIQRYIMRKGAVSFNDILRDNRRNITTENLTRVLDILQSSDVIKAVTQAGKRIYVHMGGKP